MSKKLCDFSIEEEKKWLEEEFLSEKAPGLYAEEASPYWFRFTEYEIARTEDTGNYYIMPKPGAKLEKYKPIEEGFSPKSKILIDFFQLLLSLPKNEYDLVTTLKNDADFASKANNEILKFCNKYGLFGFYWRKYAFECYFGESGKWSVPGLLPVGNPKTIYSGYREWVTSVFEGMGPIPFHFRRWNEYIKGNETCINDLSKLNLRELNLGITFEAGEWQLSWNFNSLIEALSIMYLLNFTGKMGKPVKVCALDGCNKAFKGKGKYCCSRHGDCHRQRRSRRNRSKKENQH